MWGQANAVPRGKIGDKLTPELDRRRLLKDSSSAVYAEQTLYRRYGIIDGCWWIYWFWWGFSCSANIVILIQELWPVGDFL